MHRVTITIDDDLLEQIDALAAQHGIQKRSEVIRDLVRSALRQIYLSDDALDTSMAALVYVYDHSVRVSRRSSQTSAKYHDILLATLHVQVDEGRSMEIAALNGLAGDVRHFADHIIGERGVVYGRVVMIPPPVKMRGKRKS